MALRTVKLWTSGMHCRSCSALVDLTLGDLPGVTASATDHATGETSVTFDPELVSVEGIIDAIRGVGYEAEVGE